MKLVSVMLISATFVCVCVDVADDSALVLVCGESELRSPLVSSLPPRWSGGDSSLHISSLRRCPSSLSRAITSSEGPSN
jgi:hypothetical protein